MRVLTEAQRSASNARARAWYANNRDLAVTCQKARMQRNWAIMDTAKAVPCADCGVQYPPCAMQFDHVRGTKVLPIARMKTASVKNLLAEIAKCEVRCANCHAIKTWGHSPRFQEQI